MIAWNKSETFREVVGKVINFAIDGANKLVQAFENVANAVIGATNAVIRAINAVSPFGDIPEISKVSIGNIPKVSFANGGGSTGGSTSSGGAMTPVVPDRIDFAPAPLLPVIGGGGGAGGGAGGGGAAGGGVGGGGGFSTTPFPQPLPPDLPPGMIGRPEDLLRGGGTINVTVNAVTAPEGLGQEIVDALRYYNRANGPIDILVAS